MGYYPALAQDNNFLYTYGTYEYNDGKIFYGNAYYNNNDKQHYLLKNQEIHGALHINTWNGGSWKEIIYTVPKWFCLNREWIPFNIQANNTVNAHYVVDTDMEKNLLIPFPYPLTEEDMENNNHIHFIEKDFYRDIVKGKIPKEETIVFEDKRIKFLFSTNGNEYIEYFYRNQNNIPNDCSITHIKIQNPILQENYYYTLKIKKETENTELIDTFIITDTTNNSVHTITKESVITNKTPDPICIPKEIDFKITDPQPKDPDPQPKTNSNSNSGPGGYIKNTPVTPFMSIISPHNDINNSNPTFNMVFQETEEITFPKTEEIIFPKITPKMGTTFSNPSIKSWMEKLKLIETRLPVHDLRLAGSKNTDISFWKQVLPEIDKNRDEYIVIPSRGLVIPITKVDKNSTSYQSFISGNNEDFIQESYNGSVMLPGSEKRIYGENGNKIIGGHSSWWKNTENRYKTHFQTLIKLETNTEIWIYKKNTSNQYIRYIYRTIESYNTSDNDISILKNTPEKKLLTLFTCTPIGGDIGRWVVKAEFIGNN